ncbi:tRNA (N(6)-L-threonylcarbamoyladenosine(37)-C(2))-methylthiotransferase MtaB [Lewinella sp. JB7]|uniref:tRNA (N(6)-L-threonylcarbamoyladenosine(37)-C(2))- methylthiotransferase MtaB n=1 Tax=Lewinella sp. JB7 TaxID=2962887 RepID=UPI0020C9A8E8|nr:tRNA (N(6)-L-threonylcarbamoyladenosine(37)-C(2))-methylthiotransferase MtaB [Lewinella sp. JB7]MCP9234772.1 tRNA (N(6)-L-threonylcarbamoyladenosine(37)-C(2))-methylthiotransferase MtaB [Lewinella sp. JB7]
MSTIGTVSFYTLGCKLNYSETSAIGRQFEAAGYREVPFREGADVVVINTCSVTEFADRKCRNVVRRALGGNAGARIIVVGCYAQLKPDEIANIEGVDLVLGAAEKFRILDFIDGIGGGAGKGMVRAGEVREADRFVSSFSFGDRTRSFLKVQDGCDYKCTFCTIPLARGASRSSTVEQIVSDAEAIAARGVKEIVLTGVNIGDFGNGTAVIEGQRPRKEALFVDLARALDKVAGITRFRISSIEPNLCTDEVIEFVANSERFAPHFHMPLQSGNNKQLAQMRRRYRRELFAERVSHIRKVMPHCCIGVDLIVGFPGETEEDFLETYRFVQELDITYLHVFTYSERANTPAADMEGAVPLSERRRRNKMLGILSEKKRRAFYERHLGEVRPVLLEKSKTEGLLHGFTDNYVKVEFPADDSWVNHLVPMELTAVGADGLVVAEVADSVSVSGR